MRPTWGLFYWPIFIMGVVAAFAGPELAALFTNAKNTLSWFAWTELGIGGRYDPHQWFWWASLAGTVLIMAVLVGHIWFRVPN